MPPPNPSQTTVAGKITYLATDGSVHPARDIVVGIVDADGTVNSDGTTGSVVACGTTDDYGNYSIPVSTYRSDGITLRKVFVRAYAESTSSVASSPSHNSCAGTVGNGGFDVVNAKAQVYTFDAATNAETTVQGGSISLTQLTVPDVQGVANDNTPFNEETFAIADEFVTAEKYLVQANQLQPERWVFPPLTVQFDSATKEQFEQSIQTVSINPNDAYFWDPNLHEFGHYVADVLGIDTSSGGDHSYGDNNAALCAKKHPESTTCKATGLTLAWSEGVATFTSLMIQKTMNVAALAIPLAGDDVYSDPPANYPAVNMTTTDINASSQGQLMARGEDDELSVARALWQIYVDPGFGNQTGWAILNYVAAKGYSVFSDAIGAIAAGVGAAPSYVSSPPPNYASSEPLTDRLSCILGGQAIAPVMQAYQSDALASTPGTYIWTPGGAGVENPLNSFEVQFWSADWSTLAYQSPRQGSTVYTPTLAVWQQILASTNSQSSHLTAFHVVVVGWSTTAAPATGPYRSCAVSLQGPLVPALEDNSGPKLGDQTGQSVALSGDGTLAIVGSPGHCLGSTGGTCDPSAVSFWSYDAVDESWARTASFTPLQLGLPGCDSNSCYQFVSLGSHVAMSDDGLTAATTVAFDTSGDQGGPWSIAVVTFALENGQWVSTGEPTAAGMPAGVIDEGIGELFGTLTPPTETLALSDSGDELAVADNYHPNASNSESTTENGIDGEGQVDLFYSDGSGDPHGFTGAGDVGPVIADPTVDPNPPASCPEAKACSAWTEIFGEALALSGDGNTLVVSDSAQYVTQASPSFTVDESADVFSATGTGGGRSWSTTPTILTGSDVQSDYSGNGSGGEDDFATSLDTEGSTPETGLAVSDNGQTILVGNPGHNSGAGSAYVFSALPAGGYQESAELTSSDPNSFSLGASVSLSSDGNTALIGAPNSDVGMTSDAGEAEVFTAGQNGWVDGNEVKDGRGPSVGTEHEFGSAVDLNAAGTSAVFGSPGNLDDDGCNTCYPGAMYFGDVEIPTNVFVSAPDLVANPQGGAQGITGASTTLSALVLPPPPSGYVTFQSPNGKIAGCINVPVGPGGTATCTTDLPDQSTTDATTSIDTPLQFSATFQGGGIYLDSASPNFPVSVESPLQITTTSLDAITAGATESQTLVATGGTPGYTWAIAPDGSDSLPADFTLNDDGTFSGVISTPGSYAFTAQVTDDSPDTQSVSQSYTLVVNPNPDGELSIVVEPAPQNIYGIGAQVSAVVSVGGANNGPPPGDSVAFQASQGSVVAATCTATLSGQGTTQNASCTLPSTLGVGTYALTATFSGADTAGGDPNYPSAVSSPQTLSIQPSASSAYFSQVLPANYGSPAMVTISIGSGGPIPVGDTVTINAVLQGASTDNATCTATFQANNNGTATCSLGSSLAIGMYQLSATFSSDPNFNLAAASATLTVLDGTTTALAPSSPDVEYGAGVTYRTTVVTSDGSAPVGTVTITAGSAALCSTSSFNIGVATCTSSATPVGDNTITATFVGSAIDGSSTGTAPITVAVVAPQAPPGSTASNSASGGAVALTASVTGITASGTGPGAITVATYGGINPTSASVTAGTGVYYDVAVGAGSEFEQLTIVACDLTPSGNGLEWWNGAVWQPFSNQSLQTSGPNVGCVVAIVSPKGTPGASPTIDELTGTPIAAVDLAAGDFTVNLTPSSQNLGENGSVGYTVNVGSSGGFAEPVALSVTGLPAGVTGSFQPATVTPGGTSLLTLTSGPTLTSTGGNFTVIGTAGALTHDTSGNITLNFALQPTCYGTISGTITDSSTQKPIGGATVEIPQFEYVTTASDGTYTLSHVLLGANNGTTTYRVAVVDGGYYSTSAVVVVSCGTTSAFSMSIEPQEYASLQGHVYIGEPNPSNPTSTPVATSTVLPGAGLNYFSSLINDYVTTSSALDGSYSFSQIPLSAPDTTNRVGFDVGGPSPNVPAYPLGFWLQTPVVSLAPGVTATQDFALVPKCTGTVVATVYSEDTGQPMPNASVTGYFNDDTASGTTGADGSYEFDNVPLGVNNAPGLDLFSATDQTGSGLTVGNPQVTLGSCGATASIAIVVHVPVTNYGQMQVNVVDATSGQPITTATVGAGYCGTELSTPTISQNPPGTFSVTGLELGVDGVTSAGCGLAVTAPGYLDDDTAVTVNAGVTTYYTAKLVPEASSTITGQVTDSVTGLPIAGIEVFNDNTTTDAQGNFTLSGNDLLGPNNASSDDYISFHSPNGRYLDTSATVEAVAGQTETLNVQMVPQCGDATVSGTVYDAANQQPLPGAEVSDQTYDADDVADQNGHFSLQIPVYNNQPFEDYLSAYAYGFNPKTEGIEVFCGAHINLDFGQSSDESGTLSGTVTNAATNQPVAGAFVGAGFGATTTTNASGVYTFNDVPTGNNNAAQSWDITVDPPSGSPLQPQIQSVVVPPITTTTLNFALDTTPPPTPTAPNYTFNTPAGTVLTVPSSQGVLSGATGTAIALDGDKGSNTDHGYVALAADGSFTYTPYSQSFSGVDSFTYTVTDEYGKTATGTVTINLTPNVTTPAPVAGNYTPSTPADTPLVVSAANGVLSADSGDTITVTGHTDPSHGAVVINADGSYTYTPTAGYFGPDLFTYTITDAESRTATGTVTVSVTEPTAPTAPTYSESTSYETPLTEAAAQGVVSDATGTQITLTSTTLPTHGTLSISLSTGAYTYTPNADYAGPDSFTYTVTDQFNRTATGTVSITVAAPAAPTAADYTETTPFNTPLVVPSASGLASSDTGTGLTYSLKTGSSDGTAVVNTDGSYTYTPNADDAGPDSFTYTVTDQFNRTATGTVSITVAAPAAPTAADYTETTPFNTPLVVPSASGLASSDTGTGLTYSLKTGSSDGTAVVNTDGSYTYTPNADYAGPDSFTYTVTDADHQSAKGTVRITVAAPGAPTAPDYTRSTPFETPLVVPAASGVLSGVTGTELALTLGGQPTHGTVTLNLSTGAYTYSPTGAYVGPDSFTYTVTDPANQTATGTVHITVAAPAAPTAADYTETTPFDTALVVPVGSGLATNDTGTGLTYSVKTAPTDGTVVVNADGSYTYTPNATYSGPDSFTYTATDADQQSATGTVGITVAAAAAPSPPVLSDVSPSLGPDSGGTAISLIGTGFTGATEVEFGATDFFVAGGSQSSARPHGIGALTFILVSPTLITLIDPAGTGTVSVSVTTPVGTSVISLADHFVYQAAAATTATTTTTTTTTAPPPTTTTTVPAAATAVPTTPTTPEPVAPTTQHSGLAFTGADLIGLVGSGLALTGLGGLLLLMVRRRRRIEHL